MMNIGIVEEKATRRRYAAWICRRWNAQHHGDEELARVRFTYWLETTRRDFKPVKKKDLVEQDMGSFACTPDGAREIRSDKKTPAPTMKKADAPELPE